MKVRSFRDIHGSVWHAALSDNGVEALCRFKRSPIYASTVSKCIDLAVEKTAHVIPLSEVQYLNFDGWLDGQPTPAARPTSTPTPTPPPVVNRAEARVDDLQRRAAAAAQGGRQAAQAREFNMTPARRHHYLLQRVEQALLTLTGEMDGQLHNRAKSIETSVARYTETCAEYGAPVDERLLETAAMVVKAINDRLNNAAG